MKYGRRYYANRLTQCSNMLHGGTGLARMEDLMDREKLVQKRVGGWFVCDERGPGWSGPWRTKEAAFAAALNDYDEANRIERQSQ